MISVGLAPIILYSPSSVIVHEKYFLLARRQKLDDWQDQLLHNVDEEQNCSYHESCVQNKSKK